MERANDLTEQEVERLRIMRDSARVNAKDPHFGEHQADEKLDADALDKALTLLREAPPPSTGPWLPIESAPKDGTKVQIARHSASFGWILGWGHYVNVHGVTGWIPHGYGPFGELGLGDPSHWMPLPSPPLSAPSGETPAPPQEQSINVRELLAHAADVASESRTIIQGAVDREYVTNESAIANALRDLSMLAIHLRAANDALESQSSPAPPRSGESQAFDFLAHLIRQREWSARTFGPSDRAKGVVAHIRKELDEIEADPKDLSEWIDVAILALDGAWRSGAQPQEIIDALVAKQTRNEGRQWPDWRTMPQDSAIEHDRSGESQPRSEAVERAIRWLKCEHRGTTLTVVGHKRHCSDCDATFTPGKSADESIDALIAAVEQSARRETK